MRIADFEGLKEKILSYPYDKKSILDHKHKAYSCLHGISEQAFLTGLRKMEEELRNGPIA